MPTQIKMIPEVKSKKLKLSLSIRNFGAKKEKAMARKIPAYNIIRENNALELSILSIVILARTSRMLTQVSKTKNHE